MLTTERGQRAILTAKFPYLEIKMLKYRTIFVQTLAAFATASVMSCSFAANLFPSENISVSNGSQSYECGRGLNFRNI